jgi:hypothetical protein
MGTRGTLTFAKAMVWQASLRKYGSRGRSPSHAEPRKLALAMLSTPAGQKKKYEFRESFPGSNVLSDGCRTAPTGAFQEGGHRFYHRLRAFTGGIADRRLRERAFRGQSRASGGSTAGDSHRWSIFLLSGDCLKPGLGIGQKCMNFVGRTGVFWVGRAVLSGHTKTGMQRATRPTNRSREK